MIQKPHTYIADVAKLPRALWHLTKQKRWVVWRWKKTFRKNGEVAWTKPPYQCGRPGTPAKSNDSSTWDSYEAAVAAVTAGHANGIGFMLKDSEVAAADLDHVRDATTGELLDWAKQLCVEADGLGLYREVTVSGCGLRFIDLAAGGIELHRKFTFNRKSGAGIELYRNTARYITISGLQEGSCEELGQIGNYLDDLMVRFNGATNFNFNAVKPQHDYFRDLIENGAPEGERSEKFQEVVWHLANLGWSIEQIVDELARFPNGIGVKYANRLLAEVTRSYRKWRARTGGGAAAANPQQQTGGSPAWLQFCQHDRRGNQLCNLANAMLALRNDPAVVGMLAHDEMYCGEVLIREIGAKVNLAVPRPVRDVDVTAIQEWLQLNGLPIIGQDTVHKAIDQCADEHRFHPVRNYLNSLQWDGQQRVESWLTSYLGAVATEYNKAIGRMFLVATVARIFRPGCQVDYMLTAWTRDAGSGVAPCEYSGH